MWAMQKVEVIPVVVRALGAIPKSLNHCNCNNIYTICPCNFHENDVMHRKIINVHVRSKLS